MTDTTQTNTNTNAGGENTGDQSQNTNTGENNAGAGLLDTTNTTQADIAGQAPIESIWGEKQPSWPEGMDGDDWKGIKESKTLKNYVDEEGNIKLPQLLKGVVGLDKLRGADTIVIPKKDASPEEKAEFLKKALGFDHNDISTYNLKEGKLTGEQGEALKQYLFDSKLPTSIADGIVEKVGDLYSSFADNWEKSTESEIAKGVETLKDKWADAFDSKVATAKRALTELGTPELLEAIRKDPVKANDPVLVELMAKVGELMYQENPIRQNMTSSDTGMTKQQMQEKINEYRSMEAYGDDGHKQHRDIHKKVDKLYERLHS